MKCNHKQLLNSPFPTVFRMFADPWVLEPMFGITVLHSTYAIQRERESSCESGSFHL